jgi:hypothetical protein
MRNINVNYSHWTPATLNNHCFNMLWRTNQKRVENTHIQNYGCLRLGVVKTDIDDNIHQQMHLNSENDAQYQCELCHWTSATLNNHCFNMLWRTKQKRVENTHIQNNGCLRLGVVRTDIDDNIHQQIHQNFENDAQYQCELCHWKPANLNNHCFNILWRTKQKRVVNTHIQNNGCLRLGVVRTDIDDNIHQQIHQQSFDILGISWNPRKSFEI